ncbi:MAG: Rieske 2Fe-2S domain-containing protein [Geminicoccaceae bacterium]|nr:Rieske 2Fe-2S domain-containing protein [Geminicoccaceae bacterium]
MARIPVCPLAELAPESVRRFDHAGRTYAVYRTAAGELFCTDGLCTHEAVHLADGLLVDYEIECPKHAGAFDIRTGEALRLPPCVDLRTWPARERAGTVEIELG